MKTQTSFDALKDSQWIWSAENPLDAQNQFAEFRTVFDAEALPARIWLSVDWNYVLYLNGQEIGRGQLADYPDHKTVAVYDVEALYPGQNTLAVLAFVPNINSSTCMVSHPGVLASVEQAGKIITSSSPTTWKARASRAFHNGPLEHVTTEIGFTLYYDARGEEDFASATYDDSAWPQAIAAPRETTLEMRAFPPINLGPRLPVRRVAGGLLRRDTEAETAAKTVKADNYAPTENANGQWSSWDVGVESTGYADVELDNAAAGTVVDLSWGEYLREGRVNNAIGRRNFTIRLTCRAGHNRFQIPFLRLGGRFVQLNITGPNATQVVVAYAGMDDFSLPLPKPAAFEAPLPHSRQLREAALRTLKCCMHEHFEDCPWREQSLYGYDSRNQMLYGYYAWGNYAFVRASLKLLGTSYKPELGEIVECAPNTWGQPMPDVATIPSFTRTWMAANAEYALYSGDLSLARALLPHLRVMQAAFLRDFDPANGLYRLPCEQGIWNFFEWSDKDIYGHGKDCQETKGWCSLHNLYTLESLQACATLFHLCGETAEADKFDAQAAALAKAINAFFWNAEHGLYATFRKGDEFDPKCHQHTQVLALALGIVPQERVVPLCNKVESDTSLVALTFSPVPYFMRGMFKGNDNNKLFVYKWLDKFFLPMLEVGATSFWETPIGATDFGDARSCCHGWSSAHVGFYGQYILGVTPLEPGFKRFAVRPWAGACDRAEGEVPTPQGMIRVRWEKRADGQLAIDVQAPAGCEAVIGG